MKRRFSSFPTKKTLWPILVVVFVIITIMGIQWATFARPPLPESLAALESDGLVMVSREPWLTFSPINSEMKTGLIFYPGGRIDPRGYASILHEIALEGYLVVVPRMPINMAVFNPNIADDIMDDHPEIDHWVIAGHSVGGVMAAQYAVENQENIDGLILWASYPTESSDLSDTNIPVVSIYASLDSRVNEDNIGDRKHLLPAETRYIRIEGGDHHQFGAYEIDPEEHLAVISRGEQHEEILKATLALLSSVIDCVRE